MRLHVVNVVCCFDSDSGVDDCVHEKREREGYIFALRRVVALMQCKSNRINRHIDIKQCCGYYCYIEYFSNINIYHTIIKKKKKDQIY